MRLSTFCTRFRAACAISPSFSCPFHKESLSSTVSSQARPTFLLRAMQPSSKVLSNASVRCLERPAGDCGRVGGSRRFSRVNCRGVERRASARAGHPGVAASSSSPPPVVGLSRQLPQSLQITNRKASDLQSVRSNHRSYGNAGSQRVPHRDAVQTGKTSASKCGSGGWPEPHLFFGRLLADRHWPLAESSLREVYSCGFAIYSPRLGAGILSVRGPVEKVRIEIFKFCCVFLAGRYFSSTTRGALPCVLRR